MREYICTAPGTNKTRNNVPAELHQRWKVIPSYWDLLWMNKRQSLTDGCNLLLLLQYTEWLFLSIICFILCRKLAHISKHFGARLNMLPCRKLAYGCHPALWVLHTNTLICVFTITYAWFPNGCPPPLNQFTKGRTKVTLCIKMNRWILFSYHNRVN